MKFVIIDNLLKNLPLELTKIIYDFSETYCDKCHKQQYKCKTCGDYSCTCDAEEICNLCFKIKCTNCNDKFYEICTCCNTYLCEKCWDDN